MANGTNGWTQAHRDAQARRMRTWRPWLKSTGPRTDAGKAIVSQNSYRGAARHELRAVARALRVQASSLAELRGDNQAGPR